MFALDAAVCFIAQQMTFFLYPQWSVGVVALPALMQQVLGLTYESAPTETWEQYLGHIFKPLTPMMLYGRDASLQPRCPPTEAVYWGWKDTVVDKHRSV